MSAVDSSIPRDYSSLTLQRLQIHADGLSPTRGSACDRRLADDHPRVVAQRLLIWSLRTVGAENAAGQRKCRLPGGRSSRRRRELRGSAQRGRSQIGAPQGRLQHPHNDGDKGSGSGGGLTPRPVIADRHQGVRRLRSLSLTPAHPGGGGTLGAGGGGSRGAKHRAQQAFNERRRRARVTRTSTIFSTPLWVWTYVARNGYVRGLKSARTSEGPHLRLADFGILWLKGCG